MRTSRAAQGKAEAVGGVRRRRTVRCRDDHVPATNRGLLLKVVAQDLAALRDLDMPLRHCHAELFVLFYLVGLKQDRRIPVGLAAGAGRELRCARRCTDQRRYELATVAGGSLKP